MIFSLDEELGTLSLGAPNPINENDMDTLSDAISSDTEYLAPPPESLNSRPRRRSSILDRFPIFTPANVKHVSITGDEDNISEEAGSSTVNGNSSTITQAVPIPITSSISGSSTGTITRTVKDFRPVRVLGQGAYGKVILVKDKLTNKLYAMKQLKKAEILITESPKSNEEDDVNLGKRIERTFAEKSILAELEHPNIVKLFYSFHDNSKLYLLLQYIPGGELFFHLKEQGTLDEDTVAFYAAEISCALKFLHDKGIVYRDLKPENCLLNDKGHLVLTDFGLSKKSVTQNSANPSEVTSLNEPSEDLSTLHSIIGTPEYCAPEILQGLPYNKNCDWYSLGCLIYDMLSGKPPYTGANHKVILNKIQKDKQGPKIPYYLSEGMKDMLNWLLKKDQSKRWDVDKYWAAEPIKNGKNQMKKKKPSKERTLRFQSHFIFRKIDWSLLESGAIQHTSVGPIVPIITDLELAENFDSEFTSMSYEDFDSGLGNEKG